MDKSLRPATDIATPLPRALITFGALGVVAAAAFAIWFLAFRDTWEADASFRIELLSNETIALVEANKPVAAIETFDDLETILNGRALKDEALREIHLRAKSLVEPLRAELDRKSREAENKRRESETLAKLRSAEADGASLEKAGDLEKAKLAYEVALDELEAGRTPSRDFDVLASRLSVALKRTSDAIKIRDSNREMARQAAANSARLASIRAVVRGGAWVTRKAGSSDPLRGLDIYLLKRTAKTTDLVPFYEALVNERKQTLDRRTRNLEQARRDYSRYPDIYRELELVSIFE